MIGTSGSERYGDDRHRDERTHRRATVVEHHLTWSSRWETSLGAAEHAALTRLLASSYPTTPAFAGERSWAGARPELRVVGRQGDEVVAHAGVIPRFLRTDRGTAVLVGDVGLVAVCPGRQGEGLGAALMRAVAATLARLEVPFGFLTCDDEVRLFYERCGWTALTDRVVRSVAIDHAVEDGRRHGMVLPVRAEPDSWPAGTVVRNGQEI